MIVLPCVCANLCLCSTVFCVFWRLGVGGRCIGGFFFVVSGCVNYYQGIMMFSYKEMLIFELRAKYCSSFSFL